MRKIFVAVTIDTEPDSDSRWNIKWPLSFESITTGIPDILSPLFVRYNVKPVYFVSPAVLESQGSVDVLAAERSRGAEIGSHLHVEDFYPSLTAKKRDFSCYSCSDDFEYDKIKKLGERIEDRFDAMPTSFRAGRFGADIGTVRSLERLGYHVDSSVTPRIDWSPKGGPDFRGFPDQPYFIDTVGGDFKKKGGSSSLLEVPVTIGGKRGPLLPERWFLYRWLRPSFMTVIEQKWLIQDLLKMYAEGPACVLCMMFHTTEVIPGTSPYVRDKAGQAWYIDRLNKVFGFLAGLGAEFVTLEDVYKKYEELRKIQP